MKTSLLSHLSNYMINLGISLKLDTWKDIEQSKLKMLLTIENKTVLERISSLEEKMVIFILIATFHFIISLQKVLY